MSYANKKDQPDIDGIKNFVNDNENNDNQRSGNLFLPFSVIIF